MMKILFNRNFTFTLGFAAGLVFGSSMEIFSFLNMPILMLIMTLSFTETDFSPFKDLKKSSVPFMGGVFLNYFMIFFVVLLLGRLFGIEGELWAGLVLTAATPPGLAIMPFTAVVGGSMFYATAATLSAFLAALLLTPWLTAVFIGNNAISYISIARLLVLLLLIPLFIGRICRKVGLGPFAMKIHGPVVNLGFGIIFAIILGVNRNLILLSPEYFIKLLLISAITIFGLAYAAKYILSKKNTDKATGKSIVLTSTVKNSIFGATAGLALLGPEGALPGTIFTLVTLLYLMFVDKILS